MSLEAAPCLGESNSPEMTLEDMAGGHEGTQLGLLFPLYNGGRQGKEFFG